MQNLIIFSKLIARLRIRLIFLIIFVFVYSILYAQTLSEIDIKELAQEINEELQGTNIASDITIRGCFSYGRTIVYQYDVTDEWFPTKSMKKDVIQNFKVSGISDLFFINEVNVDFYYYTGSKIREKITIKSHEFSNFNFDLGEYISIKGHPKAKEVNMKLKQPDGWEISEGDRPNVVKKFVYKTNTYLIVIKNNIMFFSRNEVKELWLDDEYVNKLITESSAFLNDAEILNYKIVTIDTYPSLEFTMRGSMEESGYYYKMIVKFWVIFYEDKIVTLQCGSLDEMEFNVLENFYNMITNSVIFPEHYN